MNEIPKYGRILTLLTLLILVLCLIAVMIFPSHRGIFFGFMLGSTISLINTIYLGYKVNKITEMAASGNVRRFASIGFGFRIALSVLAIILAVRNPQYFNILAVAGSLVLSQFFALFVGVGYSKRGK